MFRKTMAWILTAAMLAAAGSAAAEGLFARMIDTDYADDRLPALESAAETIAVSQTTGSVTVEVSQAYYEGDRVYISYAVKGPGMVMDGLELEDGAYADIIAGGSADAGDGSVIGWMECVVPEDELADTQTFCLACKTPESDEKQLLRFTLQRHEYDALLQGDSPAAAYQARALLHRGKVDLKGVVTMTSPEQAACWLAWQEGGESAGTDVILFWSLYRNGEPVCEDLAGSVGVNGTEELTFEVMFPAVEDLTGLTLVPVYSDAGDRPEEAIALAPADPE